MDQDKIGKFIAKLRKDKNMTQEQLAEKLGVNSKSISRWENAKCMPDLSLLVPLSKELGISVNDLLSGKKNDKEGYQKEFEENMINIVSKIDKDNKKRNKIILIISITVVSIVLLCSIFGIIDYNRVENGKKPIFTFHSVVVSAEDRVIVTEYYGLGYKIATFSSVEKPRFLPLYLGSYAWFIGSNDYKNFEITFKERDKKSDSIMLKILADSYTQSGESVPAKIYTYGINEIKITIDNKTYLLEEALKQNIIIMSAITTQLNDEEHLYDGGTIIYRDSNSKKVANGNLTIIKCHAVFGMGDFNQDIYIGDKNMVKEEDFCK